MKRLKLTAFNCTLLLSLLVLVFIYSCRKINSQTEIEQIDKTEKFFTSPNGTDDITKRVIEEIKKRNIHHEFVNKFASDVGFPVWNKVLIRLANRNSLNSATSLNPEIDSLVYIPLVAEGQQVVSGYILAKVEVNNISLLYTLAKDYKAYSFVTSQNTQNDASQFALLTMVLNKNVFGINSYTITDPRLFSPDSVHIKTKRITIKDEGGNLHASARNLLGTCWDISWQNQYCGTPSNYSCIPNCDNCGTYCYTLNSEISICSAGASTSWPPGGMGGAGTPTGGGGGSSGGGDIPYYYPCNPYLTSNFGGSPVNNIGTNPLPPCPPPSGGSGWNPSPNTLPNFNPSVAPPPTLDTSITNHFPCVQRILNSISLHLNINAIAQKTLHEIFNIDKHIQLNYSIDWSLQKDSLDGYEIQPNFNTGSDTNFHAEIKLNPWVLANSTEEYIAATIIHEAIHSFLDYKHWQYIHGQIDSATFKNLFPNYWPLRRTNGTFNSYLNQNNQHNTMAANVINSIKTSLSYVNSNPNLSVSLRDSIYTALAWGGLKGTKSWRIKTDTLNVMAINHGIRNNVQAPFLYTAPFPSISSIICNQDSDNLHLKKGCN